LEIKGKVSSKA